MGIEENKFGTLFLLSTFVSSSDVMQNDQPSARNRKVIARMPEDRSNTFNNLQTHLNNIRTIYT
eukprot:14741175-Heterocapsa_arctica.AAC.1